MSASLPTAEGERQEEESQTPDTPEPSRSSSSTAPPVFVPILPRPTAPTLKTEPSISKPTISRRACKVAQCPNKNCKLASHRLYNPSHEYQGLHRTTTAGRTSKPKLVNTHSRSITSQAVDGLPSLPVTDSPNPQLRALFHHFFDAVFDRLAQLFRGPRQVPDYKSRMLSVALTNETYCMGLITQAQTDMLLARGQYEETRASLELYTKLITLFRRQLAVTSNRTPGGPPPPPAHIEIALLIICILMSYSVMHRGPQEINMNWNAMRGLVKMRGGIHYLTTALPYVVHVDRLCATLQGVLPTYVNPPERMYQFCAYPKVKYGAGFRVLAKTRGASISRSVLTHAADTCELLALQEARDDDNLDDKASQSDQDDDQPSHASAEYLYYRRDRVDEQFAVLHAQMQDPSTSPSSNTIPSKCILLATRIVEYPITWGNYTPGLIIHLATNLCSTLKSADLLTLFSEPLLNILLWILVTLATSGTPFKGREWALATLVDLIEAKYGVEDWPDEWREEETENLRDFVWAEERGLGERLEKVWDWVRKEVDVRRKIEEYSG